MPTPNYEEGLLVPGQDCHTDYAIRTLAYELWEKAGRPEGTHSSGKSWADYFWALAEDELRRAPARPPEGTAP